MESWRSPVRLISIRSSCARRFSPSTPASPRIRPPSSIFIAGLSTPRGRSTTTLPNDTESVDVVISNGVLNLVPEKRAAVAEIRRVLKSGGRVQIADIVLGVELPEDARQDLDLWTG